MTKKDKQLEYIVLNTIIQHLGKDATKEKIEEFFKKLTPIDLMKLVLEGHMNMGNGKDADFMKEYAKLGNNTTKNVDNEKGDNEDNNDNFFNVGGRLDCLPALQVKKYTIRIKLNGVSPSIWRKIEVPSNVKLTSLAEIIITAMGWFNEHLHQFRTKDRVFFATAQKEDEFNTYWGGDYSIDYLLEKEKDKVVFEYDFGDSWEHDVVLSKVEEYADNEPHVVNLIGGKRACPPEDCGGVWGYKDLCEAMKHPHSKHARELKEWLGYKFDPEEFWLDDVQAEIEHFNP